MDRPNGAPSANTALLDAALYASGVIDSGFGPLRAVAGLRAMHVGRAAGRQWKQVLPPPPE